MDSKQMWENLWREYPPTDNAGTGKKYHFALVSIPRLNKVVGKQLTQEQIASAPVDVMSVNELMDRKFTHPSLLVRALGDDIDPIDYLILRKFFNAQDKQESETPLFRPDTEDNIGAKMVGEGVKVKSMPMDVIEKIRPGAIHGGDLMPQDVHEQILNTNFTNRKEE